MSFFFSKFKIALRCWNFRFGSSSVCRTGTSAYVYPLYRRYIDSLSPVAVVVLIFEHTRACVYDSSCTQSTYKLYEHTCKCVTFNDNETCYNMSSIYACVLIRPFTEYLFQSRVILVKFYYVLLRSISCYIFHKKKKNANAVYEFV